MNTLMNYSQERAQQQIQANALKSKKIPKGTKLNFKEIITGNFTDSRGNEVPNDQILAIDPDGKRIKIPVREYLKMIVEGGGEHYSGESGRDTVKFPAGIEIKSSKNRVDKDDNPIFPVHAYNLADDFLATGSEMQWADLVAGKVKDVHPFDVVQDYTISKL